MSQYIYDNTQLAKRINVLADAFTSAVSEKFSLTTTEAKKEIENKLWELCDMAATVEVNKNLDTIDM